MNVDEICRAFGEWLEATGRFVPDVGEFLIGACGFLTARGMPFDRVTTHIKVVHPRTMSVWRIWRRDQPLEVHRPVRGAEMTAAFLRSPVKKVWHTGEWIDAPIRPGEEDRWAIVTDLRSQSFTHYMIGPIIFSNRQIHAISFATKQPGGFTAEEQEVMRRFTLKSAPIIETLALRNGMDNLLETYLGHETAQLLAQGQVTLGEGTQRRAALWYSDLRGFTSLTEGAPLEEVVQILNVYFGLAGAAADRHNGEIVQFIGDAILMFFAVTEEGGDTDACRRALMAATEARTELGRWNEARRATQEREIAFGLGLDLGNIIHVNVGGGTRQAFNIVGPAVNRAARLQELTKTLGRPLLTSSDFAGAIGDGMVSLGEHFLRGINLPIEVIEPSAALIASLPPLQQD
ncbi:MAG TPA: adenylate/guanylate cyclase domain-containing protein [Aliidongia sp.]|uniref:adenylate/guanylate cyclase domain-containing protein n=1 Tax=Aliidongia sp. TaxID=1914230 RepID=UPI002DDDAD5D|nr:adenylate/guanylate cyclase domain-containing protein [Aliidongia sp.]HEV2676016.1 adenylate/guanylate cyclase domain-containing protein [Aliidongia sp.]